jgi:DNA-binding NarL/FixJ family response regulator
LQESPTENKQVTSYRAVNDENVSALSKSQTRIFKRRLAMTTLLRIVLVDDSADYLFAVTRLLAVTAGVQLVGCATSGEEGVRLVDAVAPHLVLMDLTMPGMDGLEATRRIKSKPNAPPVMIVSLNDSETVIAEAGKAGAEGFILKGNVEQLQDYLAHSVNALQAKTG